MRATEKKYYFQYYFMLVPGTFFGMAFSRCFGIQRAVMLALYCCRGNYDELFHIGLYLLFHSPSDLFRCKSLLFCHFISLFCNNTLCSVCCRCAISCSTTFSVGMLSICFVCVCVLCCPITEAFGSSHTVLLSIALSVGCCFAVEHVK